MFISEQRRDGKWKLSFHTPRSLIRSQDLSVTITVIIVITVVIMDFRRDS
jgi:hypothetical protein